VLLLSSRSVLPDDRVLRVRPEVVRCDVGELEEVPRPFEAQSRVRGGIHAAGVLSDGTLHRLWAEDFKWVYRPKVRGAEPYHSERVERGMMEGRELYSTARAKEDRGR
jgi:hypothetical protein